MQHGEQPRKQHEMQTQTINPLRIVAIGRSAAGEPFKVVAPADWPTDSEVDAIIAKCPPVPLTMEAELSARWEERQPQAY